MPGIEGLPWRGPEGDRPDLPLPPDKVPLRRDGRRLKRWRYLGAYSEEILLCAARVQVGRLGQTFWAVWDRDGRELWERTRLRLPGARGEVWTERVGSEDVVPEMGDYGVIDHAPDEGSMVRVEARGARAFLKVEGGGTWVESVCPTSEGNYVWTRKRAGIPVDCDVRIGDRSWHVQALGVEDESCGYHPQHTVWNWSAGVGQATDGRAVAWNLVEGINDPPERSERAIWVDGQPFEPAPVSFEGLDAIAFEDGARLAFSGECERRKEESKLIVKYSYRQPFGTFTGTLPGGLELASGLGVMEHHDAEW